MNLSRRAVMAGLAATPLTASIPRPVLAQMPIGQGTVTTVSDGSLVLPANMVFDPAPKGAVQPILDKYGISNERLTPECNLTLYQDGTNTVLFDVGAGPDFMPTAGKIIDGLEAANLTPEDVTHVVFTHAHPDHIWGLLDDFDDLLFYEATYLMGRSEWDYWWNPETVNTIGAARTTFAVGAKRRLEAIEDNVSFFDDGDEVLPGIAAVACHGHTPGHMGFEIRQGNEAALIIGDAIANHHVAFQRPEWLSGSDQDTETGAATRLALFDRIKTDDLNVIGFHLPDGGIGRAEADGDGYRFVPLNG